jgi:hypothetical protein
MNILHSRSINLTVAVTALLISFASSFCRADDSPIKLENNQVLLECDPAFGTISRILDKASGIELTSPKDLAENFRLVLLLSENKTATILGKDQKLSGADSTDNGLAFHWDGPLKDTDGTEHAIAVRMDVAAVGNAITFKLHLDNGTEYKVKEVLYPMVGGLDKFGPPGKDADSMLWVPSSNPHTQKMALDMRPQQFAYPQPMCMSFTCIQSKSANKSLYFASHDEVARHKVYHFETQSANSASGVFAFIEHNPYTPPKKAFDGSVVVLRVIDGDWHAAGKVYREWFEKTFGICKPSQCWIRRESFFQMAMFGLPEGTICMKYTDIPQWAKDAKDHGVNSLMISGWQHGGHDNGYPDYTPDLRLGTWKELEDGIKACHELGMKVYFFVNYQQVMLDSDWYKSELNKYREWGPNGETTWNVGWGMGTLWARMDHPKRMTGADPAFPQYRKIIVDQFEKLASIGADGVHVDKMFPAALDFNPDIPLSPDTATWEGAILLTREVFAACRKHNADWAMSFECNWDRMVEFTGATWWVGNQLVTRQVFPENAETQMIGMAYDYLGVNNLVRDGHIVMVSPLNFCRSMGWKPWEGLSTYIKEVKRIQDRLIDTVFLGEVLGHDGVKLSGSPATGIAYSVYRNLTTSKRAAIFTNATMEPKKQAFQGFEDSQGSEIRIHTPFREPKSVKLPAEIEIPAEGIVFVEEL